MDFVYYDAYYDCDYYYYYDYYYDGYDVQGEYAYEDDHYEYLD